MRREKIKIRKIDDISARQVTFSKRRQGLIKKARELSILCEAEVAVTVISPAGRLHQYSSSDIKDIHKKFSLYLESERHQARSQEENRKYADLGRGVEDKTNYLRFITSEYLQNFSSEELHRLETKLEAKLQDVTAKKRELLANEVPPLQTKDTQAAGTLRTQSDKNKLAQGIDSTIFEASLEGTSFQFSQIEQVNAKFRAINNPERWVPPPPDVYKVNFARANFQDMHASGVGVVVRSWGGVFMAALARFLPELMDSNTTTLMAAKCAVEFCVDYHFTHIVLEGDDQSTINQLKNTYETQSPVSNVIMEEVVDYMRQLGCCFFSHVQRSGNDAAHMVAQYARNVEDEIVWLMEEPDFLGDILLADVAQ
ncbi:hypothetical protein BUALT_Bualt01G0005700 [Buddleja alternifolia]|uniref:MADS-box domain-containing protein n=1 Tax=Buddleja alternifolia TaxID=168488 RepID=A0AAV6Y9E5_9LAMI|nr:hypothetical protein BUALT_Bualt01G0005700 [Buddleja alternifolia]